MSDVTIVNEHDEEVGTASYEEAHRKGLPHRIVVVYLTNEKSQILIQERMDGGLDHSAAGHVDNGESYKEAAFRELEEELGVKATDLKYIGRSISERKTDNPPRHIVHHYQVFVTESSPGKLQEDEVKSVFWADPIEIKKDMKINPGKYAGGFLDSIDLFLGYKSE